MRTQKAKIRQNSVAPSIKRTNTVAKAPCKTTQLLDGWMALLHHVFVQNIPKIKCFMPLALSTFISKAKNFTGKVARIRLSNERLK